MGALSLCPMERHAWAGVQLNTIYGWVPMEELWPSEAFPLYLCKFENNFMGEINIWGAGAKKSEPRCQLYKGVVQNIRFLGP